MSLKRNTSSLEWVAAITLVVAAGGNASQVSHIVGASCKIAAGGVQVVVVGFGFGPVQGKGAVWLGTAFGRVVSWSDTRINATAARNATFGKIRVRPRRSLVECSTFRCWMGKVSTGTSGVLGAQRGGLVPHGVGAVRPRSGSNIALAPNVLNLVVGDSRTIQALNSASQIVKGLTWASTAPNVVQLSADDPPLLTGVSAGKATITAGDASADITVSAGVLPMGTMHGRIQETDQASTPIVPAVPSSSGVADVFAFQGDGTVQAVTSDGSTAWGVDVGMVWPVVPDFQGGVVGIDNSSSSGSTIKWDGTTGQPYPAYVPSGNVGVLGVGIHPDGTVFATQRDFDSGPDTVV